MASCGGTSIQDAINEAGDTEAWLNNQVLDLNKIVEQLTEEISKSLAEIHRLESELLIKRQSVRDLDNDPKLTELTRLILQTQNDIDSKLISLRNLDNDRKLYELESAIKQHKESIKKLAFRDPGCPEGENSCLYIKDALAARDALPGAEVECGERKAEVEKERSDIQIEIDILKGKNKLNEQDADTRLQENITKQAALSDGATTIERLIKAVKHLHLQYSDQLKITKGNIQTSQKKLAEVKALSERKAELEIAIIRKADITAKLEEITAAGKTLRATWTEKEQAKLQQIQELVIKQAEIDKDINHGAETELAIAKQNIEDAEKQLPLIEKKIAEVRDLISKANHDLSSMLDAEKELLEIQGQKDLLVRNASEWTYLRNACSKNGLQALEIDGAAPLITGYANDLLSQAFGPLFSVKFRTLDDDGKECLDIVTIADDGTEVLLENLSGGQRVWILMALRLAMTLLSQEKSGRVYESAFADEMDGPLDPDNSINFVKMYQAFMQIGKFKTLYFISHKPSCRNLADHILKFEAGENPTWA